MGVEYNVEIDKETWKNSQRGGYPCRMIKWICKSWKNTADGRAYHLRSLWEIKLQDKVFAAASHAGVADIMNGINRVRLGTEHDYYNLGVMLMDIEKAREIIKPEDVFKCVREHEAEMVLPDQGVYNYLYGAQTVQVDDAMQ